VAFLALKKTGFSEIKFFFKKGDQQSEIFKALKMGASYSF
jgi:hypothetical protein